MGASLLLTCIAATLRRGGSDLCSPLNPQDHVSGGHGWGSSHGVGVCLTELLQPAQEQALGARPCSGHPRFALIMRNHPRTQVL